MGQPIPGSRKGNKNSIQPQPSIASDDGDYAADDFEDNDDAGVSANADDENEPTIPKNESAQKNVSTNQRKLKNGVSKKRTSNTPINND